MLQVDKEDISILKALLQNAMAEVGAAADPNATIQPDDPMSLMDKYDRAKAVLARLAKLERDPDLVIDFLREASQCHRCGSCAHAAEGLLLALFPGADRT